MLDYIPTAYLTLISVAYLITSLARHISLSRVVTRLKEIDMVRWLGMGSPRPTLFRRFSDYNTSRPENLAVPVDEYNDLSIWLKERGYEHLNDAELTLNAERYRLLGNVQLAILALGFFAFIYLRFVVHRLVP